MSTLALRAPIAELAEPTKTCPGAEIPAHTEPVSVFSRDRSRADGLAVYCRACAAAKQRAWKHANPEKVKAAKAAARARARTQGAD